MQLINASFSRELASDLLDINAVILRPNEPFVWSSGWNSPIYCDNRLTLRYPALRSKIANHIVEHLQSTAPHLDVITGTATAGIPHASWVAEKLTKPMAYVRSKAKMHGMGNQIEGGVKKDEHTVVIEDLVSTGGSVLSVIEAIEFVGAHVDQVVSIFTYGFDVANEAISTDTRSFYSLTDYSTLIEVALEKGTIQSSDLDLLNQWRAQPNIWPKQPASHV